MRTTTKITGALAALALTITAVVTLAIPGNASGRCVQYPGHDSYLCAANFIYWEDNLFTREIYWHPNPGNQVVTEEFYCLNDPTRADGHTDCLGNAPGVPPGTPEAKRRVISLADGCTVYGWNVTSENYNPPPPKWCVRFSGAERLLTTGEQRSVLAFWHAALTIPGQW